MAFETNLLSTQMSIYAKHVWKHWAGNGLYQDIWFFLGILHSHIVQNSTMIIHSYCRANKIFRQSIDNNKREDLRIIAFPSPALFRNKRFILSKGFQWNTSKICSYSCSIAKFVVFQWNISSTFNHWFLKSVSSLLLILPLLVTYILTY